MSYHWMEVLIRRLFLFFVLFGMTNLALAEWTRVNGDENGVQYIDLGKLKRNGDLVKIHTAVDYKDQRRLSGRVFSSAAIQEEYDCKRRLRRTLFVSAYSGNMASGVEVLQDFKVTDWQAIPAGSSGALLLKVACREG